jgi:hypothetical protein
MHNGPLNVKNIKRSVLPVLQASHNFLTNKLFGALLFLGSPFTPSWIRNFASCLQSEVHYPVHKSTITYVGPNVSNPLPISSKISANDDTIQEWKKIEM